MIPGELKDRLGERFPDVLVARGEVSVIVDSTDLLPALRALRQPPELAFGFLSGISATDWPDREPRFWLAYHLYSMEENHRVRVKVGLPAGDPHVPSVVDMYPTANWHEREVYDFFGIVFDGHPDLRRILMPEDWEGHPLRKDYGLGGVTTAYKGGASIPPPDQRRY